MAAGRDGQSLQAPHMRAVFFEHEVGLSRALERQGKLSNMKTALEEIRRAVELECYLPALALALTIPDVCGKITYPEDPIVRDRYKNWFDEWVKPRYIVSAIHTSDGKLQTHCDGRYFNGYLCYKLRCSLLHENNDHIQNEVGEILSDEENGIAYKYEFELVANSCDSFGIWSGLAPAGEPIIKTIRVRIDIGTLCVDLCDSAERFLAGRSEDDILAHNVSYNNFAKLRDRLGGTQK